MSSGSSRGSKSSGQSSSLRASLSRPFRYAFRKRKNQEAGQSSNPTNPSPKPSLHSNQNEEMGDANPTEHLMAGQAPVESESIDDSLGSKTNTYYGSSKSSPNTGRKEVLSPIRVTLDGNGDLVNSRPIINDEDRAQALQCIRSLIRETFGDSSEDTMQSESGEIETMQTIGEEDYLADLAEYDRGRSSAGKGKAVNFDAGKEIIYITDSPLPPEKDVIEISSDSSQSLLRDIHYHRDRSPSVTMEGNEDDPMEADEEPRRNDLESLEDNINNQMAWARVRQGIEPNWDPFMNMIARTVTRGESTVETVSLKEAPRRNIPRPRKPRMTVRTPQELGMDMLGRGRPRTREPARKSVCYQPSAPMYDPMCTACGSMSHTTYGCPYLQESEPSTPNLVQCEVCYGYGHWGATCQYRFQGGGSGDGAGPSGTAPAVTCPFAHLPYLNRISLCGCVVCRNP